MKISKYLLFFALFSVIFIVGCEDTEGENEGETEAFDRREMLANWADNIIVPSYINYRNSLQELVAKKDNFLQDSNESTYSELTTAWLDAYKNWQHVSMFEIGKAESIGLRNFTNIYPSDVSLIEQNINTQSYNLELPSNFDAQGFPALDYLLFGIAEGDELIFEKLGEGNYSKYLDDLITRLFTLTDLVTEDWINRYSAEFIDNDGSSATASVDKMVNDFLFYNEKFLRAGKVGIPSGVFSGNKISSAVEAPYAGQYSKVLFLESLDAVENFFNGRHVGSVTTGVSLKSYLDHIRTQNGGSDIANDITAEWDSARLKTQVLSDNFMTQIEDDNIKMRELYDELQKAIVLMKVDMMQALNIQVDFIDADGD